MNEQQRLYLVQARTDWDVFQLLREQPVCHRVHYLQMCAEKLAKAYFWKGQGAEAIGHVAFTKFVRAIAANRQVAAHLGFNGLVPFGEWIKDVSDLAYEIERLAPALAAGPNPEYPWPRELPTHAPVEQTFSVWERFQSPNGRALRRMIEQLLAHFEAWF